MQVGQAPHQDRRFRELYEAHFDVVWRSLRRFGVPVSTVDDACQQVFLTTLRRLEDVQPGRERAYLLGVAVRVASDARRAHARRLEDAVEPALLAERIDPAQTPEEASALRDARARLDGILEAFPEALRTVFVLYEVEGLTAAEIAESLEIPPGTVASRLRRARELFREQVASLQRRDQAREGSG